MTAPLKLTTSMPQNVMIDAINQNFRQIEGESRRKVVTDENGYDRIIIGRQEDETYSIKVSGIGVNVGTATDDQLVMNSDWNMWKIISSGSTYSPLMSGTIKRGSSITINSSNIGYVADQCIPLRNLTVPNASLFSFASKPQVFVRVAVNKKNLAFTTNFYNDGTNQVDVHYNYFINGKYLVIRTILRWVKGSITIMPSTEAFEDGYYYWEIANSTRATPSGSGGGGSPTGSFVYYDSVTVNPYTNDLSGVNPSFTRTTVSAGTYSSVYSYTYQFIDGASSARFPHSNYTLPVIPAVDIDN